VIIIRVTLKNLEFAQMQDVEKIRRAAYVLYVSKKFLRNAVVGMKSGLFEMPVLASSSSRRKS